MTDQQIARGRRAVAAMGGKWRPGMRVRVRGEWMRLVSTDDGIVHVSEVDGSVSEFPPTWVDEDPILDVDDPATLGCITALARETLGEPGAYAAPFCDGKWGIRRLHPQAWIDALCPDGKWSALVDPRDVIREPAEPEAWLAALEAAGRRDGKAENQRSG